MGKSAVARALARFRQLSCLGLGSELVIPALLNELHAIIPSHANTFFFADRTGNTSNIHFENPDFANLFPLYQREFLGRRDQEFKGLSFSEAAKTQFGVHEFRTSVSVEQNAFLKSDLHNLILRPAGNDPNFLRHFFRSNGRVLGCLSMWRSEGLGEWTEAERRLLGSLETFFVHALTGDGGVSMALVDSGLDGLLVADAGGKLIYSSAAGRRLLYYATHDRVDSGGSFDKSHAVLPGPLVRLCVGLARIFTDDPNPAAPSYHCSNVWGGFDFRAQWLDLGEPGSSLIGITVSHEVPVQVRLARSLGHLKLSPRQTEVCALVAMGASAEEVSERLGITKSTAITHNRAIYAKLDVHNRSELLAKLLSM